MYLGALAAVANQGIAYKNIYTLFSTKVFRLFKRFLNGNVCYIK